MSLLSNVLAVFLTIIRALSFLLLNDKERRVSLMDQRKLQARLISISNPPPNPN
jgi:hypothetical protein